MKTLNIKKTSLLAVLFLAITTSCNFLELESVNDLNSENFFKTAGDAESALVGLYSSMQSPNYYGGNYLLIGEPLSGNSITGGFDNVNLDELGFRAVTTTNIMVEEMWYTIYNTVANANHLIKGLSTITDPAFDVTRKKEIEGQAKAIRALAHFDLLRFFGEHWNNASSYGIPVVNTIQKIGDVASRATVGESYSFIIGELTESLNLVNPDERDPAFINATTIHALLARVYLYNKNYALAAEQATIVIDDGAFSLFSLADYASVFMSRQTPESIFELAFDSQNRSRYNGLTYSRPDALNTEINFLAAEELNVFFSSRPGDVRAALTDYDPNNNDASIQPNGRTQKYRGEATEDSPAYILRLAEMYLIRAEANGRTNGLSDLNIIRTQRGLNALTAIDIPDDNTYKFALLEEIRAEFNFEGHYFFDLARLGEIKPGGLFDTDSYRAILPIPLREITATKDVLIQNPEYN